MLINRNELRRFVGCFVILTALLPFMAARLLAQADRDPAELLREAVDQLNQGKISKTRFTYLDLSHLQNFNEKGKSTLDIVRLTEITYIADLEYSRLLEVNGKPLTGKALAEEQQRYDDAIRGRSALDDKARAKLWHYTTKNTGVNLNLLPTSYRSSVVGHAAVDGRDCLLIDSVPLDATQQKHYRTWVDPATSEMMRMEFTQIADEGDVFSGSTGATTLTYIDGIPLLTTSHIDAMVKNKNKRSRIVVDHTYSRFRKFSVSTKIVSVEPEGKP